MRALSGQQIVDAWGRGLDRAPLDRALMLLSAAEPEPAQSDFSRLSIGERDGLLLALRRMTFGTTLPAYAKCRECDAILRFELDIEELERQQSPTAGSGPMVLTADGFEVEFRLPTARDLEAVSRYGSADAYGLLLERCVIEARRGEAPVAARQLPESVLAALSERMESEDPLADIPINLACDLCGHKWSPILDIGSCLWAEVEASAERIMYEVASLANLYGWSESESLAMGPARRKRYLELARRRG